MFNTESINNELYTDSHDVFKAFSKFIHSNPNERRMSSNTVAGKGRGTTFRASTIHTNATLSKVSIAKLTLKSK